MRRFWMAMCLALACVALPLFSWAQSACTHKEEAQAELPSTDPIYVDAMDLVRKLIDNGFIVKCVLVSKEQHGFEGQKGGALFRTDQGSFGAAFLPQTETFDGLEVVEQRQGNRYIYSFRGRPHSSAHIDSSKPTYYIKFGNVLFDVWGDAELAEKLKAIR
jgi:hypothetical protein